VALTYRVTRLARLGMFSVVAAALGAADPLLLNQSTLVMTETLAALLSMVVLWRLVALDRRPTYFSAATAGIAIGLAALCRPTYLPLLALVPAAMIVLRRSSSSSQDSATTQRPELMSSDETSTELAESLADRNDAPSPSKKNARADSPLVRRAKLAGVVAASILLTLAPWAVRNRLTFGIWKVTTTHGGYTLLLGNNPEFYEHLRTGPAGSVWAPRNDEQLMEDARAAEGLPLRAELRSAPSGRYYELEDDALAYRQAKRFIQAEPAMFIRACLFRVSQFWSPWPHTGGTLARQAVGVWYVGVFCAAVIGLVARRRELLDSPWLWSGLIVACFVAAHVAYWSNLRMRAPIMPLIALAAAAGVEKFFRILLKSRAV
ncbi:MAG TPA: hypothetical protein PLV92_10465, partial [Pirellulaceae bacterium]|nr:hypothetical protein [Pirellulaceae bacterium]